MSDETPEESRASTELLSDTNVEPVPTGDQVEQTVVEDTFTESTNQNQAVNNQSETNLSHSEEPHPLDKDQNHDKLLLTRGQDFDLDYTLLGNGFRPSRD